MHELWMQDCLGGDGEAGKDASWALLSVDWCLPLHHLPLVMLHRSSFRPEKSLEVLINVTSGEQLPVAEGPANLSSPLYVALTGAEKQAHPAMCGVYLGNTWRVYLPFSTCKTQWQGWGYPREYVKTQHSRSWWIFLKDSTNCFLNHVLLPCIPKPCIKTFFRLKVWLCSGLADYAMPCELNLQYSFDFRQINSS